MAILRWLFLALLPSVFATIDHSAKRFHLTLTWEKHAPDGLPRNMILINGQYPGPLLELDEGDDVNVVVQNNMPYNTTMHFHGIEMRDTPWSDGVPGLTQRQIQPGCSFTYRWTATQYGSYWYHAHQRGQLDDGMYGPILIRPKPRKPKPFYLISNDTKALKAMEEAETNVKPLVLSDFRHITSQDAWDVAVASGIETPCYDSILVNGRGSVNCWSPEYIASLVNPVQKQFYSYRCLSHM